MDYMIEKKGKCMSEISMDLKIKSRLDSSQMSPKWQWLALWSQDVSGMEACQDSHEVF